MSTWEPSTKPLRCCECGHEGIGPGWRVHPRGGGIVCDGRYDQAGHSIGCYERIDREEAFERGRQVERDRERVRAGAGAPATKQGGRAR